MNLQRFILTTVLTLFLASTYAQKGVEDMSKYGHGEDSSNCIINLSLFKEYAKQKNYADALSPWTLCYNECPISSIYIYLYGEDIIKWEMKQASSDEEKEEKFNKLMGLYDQRIKYNKYFGKTNSSRYPEGYILLKKALDFYAIKGKTTSGQKESMEMFEAGIKMIGTKFYSRNTATVLQSVQNYMGINFDLYARDEIRGEQLINNYDKIQNYLSAIIPHQDNYADDINKMKDIFESNFVNTGAADCETMETLFAAKIKESPEDQELLNKVLNMLEKTECTDSELFYSASERLHNLAPSSASAYGMAKMYLSIGKEDIDKALEFYNEAIELAEDDDRKAMYYYSVAFIQFSKKADFITARNLARKAIQLKSGWGDPYILIGQMYAQSAQKQQLGSKDIENQAGFWAAVDMFEKAKQVDPEARAEAEKNITIYKNYFPNKEKIFFEEGYDLSKPVRVGGWINETTICRPRE